MLIFNRCTTTQDGDIYKEARYGGLSFVCVVNPLTNFTVASISDDSGVIDQECFSTEQEGKAYLLRHALLTTVAQTQEVLEELSKIVEEL